MNRQTIDLLATEMGLRHCYQTWLALRNGHSPSLATSVWHEGLHLFWDGEESDPHLYEPREVRRTLEHMFDHFLGL